MILPSRMLRYAVILAAGKGTRFKSEKPKVLHEICGKPMVTYLLDRLGDLGIGRSWIIVGEGADQVRSALSDYPVTFRVQEPQLGTGHAVMTVLPELERITGSVLVLYGDTPLIPTPILERLFSEREESDADEVLLTAELDEPTGYGRILRGTGEEVLDIIEEKEATPSQKAIREINAGFACFKAESLVRSLPLLTNDNRAGEYYLTDLVRTISSQGGQVRGVRYSARDDIFGINNRVELASAEARLRHRINRDWMERGVTLLDPARTVIDADVQIGPDTTILVGAVLRGSTRIGANCLIGTYTYLEDAVLEDNVHVEHCSMVRGQRVGSGRTVPPFSLLDSAGPVNEDAPGETGAERG
ncbi:MAG: NTP transferase domain-containing protein [Acidobacteriota bacterium]